MMAGGGMPANSGRTEVFTRVQKDAHRTMHTKDAHLTTNTLTDSGLRKGTTRG